MGLEEVNIFLWKIWCCFILSGFIIINSYYKGKIRELRKKRKQYNLISISCEVDLSEEEELKLEQLMNFYGFTDSNSFFREQLKKVI